MSFPFALSSAALGVVALLVAGCSPAAPAPERDAQAAVHGPAADQHGAGKPRRRNTIQTVTLIGADGHRAVLAAADLATLPRERFSFDRHGEVRTYEGPLLLDVMALVGAGATPLHAPDLATVVLIESADGYQVALGLAETDPATRTDRIILADRADGAPLSAEDGPFMLIAEGDVRPARSARMVTSIKLIALAAPAR